MQTTLSLSFNQMISTHLPLPQNITHHSPVKALICWGKCGPPCTPVQTLGIVRTFQNVVDEGYTRVTLWHHFRVSFNVVWIIFYNYSTCISIVFLWLLLFTCKPRQFNANICTRCSTVDLILTVLFVYYTVRFVEWASGWETRGNLLADER